MTAAAERSARVVSYRPDFCGRVRTGINAGDLTGRLLVEWDIRATGVDRMYPDPRPPAPRPDRHEPVVRVGVPRDVERLRATDARGARAYRRRLRDALPPLLTEGYRVTDFDRAGWYVRQRPRR